MREGLLAFGAVGVLIVGASGCNAPPPAFVPLVLFALGWAFVTGYALSEERK